MTLKAILFDLDGVLVNTRTLHYETFRQAYETVCSPRKLSWKEHLEQFDGLSTRQKLAKLIAVGVLNEDTAENLFQLKQHFTLQLLPEYVKPRPALKNLLVTLQEKGYRLACVSNSIRSTLDETLRLLEIKDMFELTLSNTDVSAPKPSPELYHLCFQRMGLTASNCLICEDSERGREAAYASGAQVLEIEDAEDLTLEKIERVIQRKELPSKPILQVVIPMAGEGSRFRTAGYTVPKPFIDVKGKPMIQWVIENMFSSEFTLKFIFLCRTSHIQDYNIKGLFDSLGLSYTIVPVNSLTEGAACTVLLAKDYLDFKQPLIIVNSDQFLEWNATIFYRCLMNPTYDGVISTFYSPDPSDTKWSFARLNSNLLVTEVAEKVWLGPNATTGIYGWKRASDFIDYAQQMIQKNIRVKNEFYVCPVYNEAIQDAKLIRTLDCKKLWGLGVPEDLTFFLNHFQVTDTK